jgi:hypothetical protein
MWYMSLGRSAPPHSVLHIDTLGVLLLVSSNSNQLDTPVQPAHPPVAGIQFFPNHDCNAALAQVFYVNIYP